MFATYRPHAFPGAALRDRLTRGPPWGRKWTCETERKRCWDRIRCLYYPAACRRSKRCSPLLFLISWTVYHSWYQSKKWWRWRTPVGSDTDSVCIWLPGAPKNSRNGWAVTGSKEPGGSSLSRHSCSGRHQTGEWAGFLKRQPELLAARRERDERLYEDRAIVPSCGGQETKSERAANGRAGERVVSLEVEVGLINPRKNFLFVEGTHGSQRRLNAPFETGVQADKRPGAHGYPVGHYSEELQWTTARIGCRNSHLKSALPGHCHMSDGAQKTRTFLFVEGTHVHWQATAEQFFFSKFNMHIMFI